MDLWIVLLRVLHIVSGAFWTGGAVLLAFFLIPAIRDAGPAGGQVMQRLVGERKLPIWLTLAGLVTLLSGLAMFVRNGALTDGVWYGTGTAQTLGVGAVLALAAGILGNTVSAGTARRMAALGAAMRESGGGDASQAARMRTLQTRLAKAQIAVASLLLLATTAMAIARYT